MIRQADLHRHTVRQKGDDALLAMASPA